MGQQFRDSADFYRHMQALFDAIQMQQPGSLDIIAQMGVLVRIRCHAPTGEIQVDGRRRPIRLTYGDSTQDANLEIRSSADNIHQIFTHEKSLRKSLTDGSLDVHGSRRKALKLTSLFVAGRTLYPAVLSRLNTNSVG